MDDNPTLRVEAKFKNARLYNAIDAYSVPAFHHTKHALAIFNTGKVHAFCRLYRLSYSRVCQLLTLKIGPVIKLGRGSKTAIRPLCIQLAEILNSDVDWLFPPELYARGLTPVALEGQLNQFVGLHSVNRDVLALPPSQYDTMRKSEIRSEILTAISTQLTPREEKIITMRFGLDGQPEYALEDIGNLFGIGRERVRQIEARALKKLRHPRRRFSKRCRPDGL